EQRDTREPTTVAFVVTMDAPDAEHRPHHERIHAEGRWRLVHQSAGAVVGIRGHSAVRIAPGRDQPVLVEREGPGAASRPSDRAGMALGVIAERGGLSVGIRDPRQSSLNVVVVTGLTERVDVALLRETQTTEAIGHLMGDLAVGIGDELFPRL